MKLGFRTGKHYTREELQNLFRTTRDNATKLCRSIPHVVSNGEHDASTEEQDKRIADAMERRFVKIRPLYDKLQRNIEEINDLYSPWDFFFADQNGEYLKLSKAEDKKDPLDAVWGEFYEYFTYIDGKYSTSLDGMLEDLIEACCIKQEGDTLRFDYLMELGDRSDTEEYRKWRLEELVHFCDQEARELDELFAKAEQVIAEYRANHDAAS